MSKLGLGVMIGYLAGNERSVKAFRQAQNKEIEKVFLKDDELHFAFTDGTKVKFFDDGQSCCEDRYMTTDDELQDFVGANLLDIEIADAPDVEDEWGVHEVQFMKVKTSKGVFTMESHNEHNGYYGGFLVRAELLDQSKAGE